jgi:hypothetical protein
MESLAKYENGKVPSWLVFERARPLRLVVMRMQYRVQIGYGPGVLCWRDRLSCGHIV